MDRERIWQRNAELGEVGRMCRIARRRQIQIPFAYLENAVIHVMYLLIGANNRVRPAYDKRTEADLVFELALAYAVLSSTPPVPEARRLHLDLHDELTRRNAQSEMARALSAMTVSDVCEPPDPIAILSSRM